MPKFITHESLAFGMFNADFNSGRGQWSPWEGYLISSLELLTLLVKRMGQDFEQTSVKMRKAYSAKDVESWKGLGIFYFLRICNNF